MNYFFIPEKKEIDSKAERIIYFAVLLYIVSLFSHYIPVVTNITMGIIFISCFFLIREGIKSALKRNKVLLGIIFFYLVQLLSIFYSTNKKDGFHLLSDTVPFFLIPVSFLFIEFKNITWNRILHFFAAVTTIASIVGFSAGAYTAYTKHDTGYLYNDNICFVMGKQAVYFAFYVSVAIIIYVYQLVNSVHKAPAGIIYLAILWLFVIIFLLASRTAMFSLLLILSIYSGNILIQRKKYMEISIFFFSLIIGSVILVKLFPKTLNRFKGTTEMNYQFDNKNTENHFNADFDKNKWNSSNTRAAIWTCAMEVWKEHPVWGTGIGDKKDELQKKYEEKNFWFAINTNKSTHNQYLDVLISMGIIGLLIFVICYFIFPLWIFFKQKQSFAIMLFLLLALCLITENMFSRYQGIVLLALILPLATKIVAPTVQKTEEPENII